VKDMVSIGIGLVAAMLLTLTAVGGTRLRDTCRAEHAVDIGICVYWGRTPQTAPLPVVFP
jgi:hypothetical protein